MSSHFPPWRMKTRQAGSPDKLLYEHCAEAVPEQTSARTRIDSQVAARLLASVVTDILLSYGNLTGKVIR